MNHQLDSVMRYLQEQRLKLVTAESCTAGMIASTLAEAPGSGNWLECAIVAYSADTKVAVLGVQPDTIARCNLTSEEVAREMAEGALRLSRANVAVANTGVAGPSAGEGGIAPGTICFSWSFQRGDRPVTFSETQHFSGDRNAAREAGTEYAISRIGHYHKQLCESGADVAAPGQPMEGGHGAQHGLQHGLH